jgi:hypothetical protein
MNHFVKNHFFENHNVELKISVVRHLWPFGVIPMALPMNPQGLWGGPRMC